MVRSGDTAARLTLKDVILRFSATADRHVRPDEGTGPLRAFTRLQINCTVQIIELRSKCATRQD
jgi:hypothetical protein